MKIMAVDYGDVRTGLAFSDLSATLVGEAFTIEERDMERLAARLTQEAEKRGVGRIVLGKPLNMDGSAGPRAKKSAALAARLAQDSGLEVCLWDERRTTVDAHRILSETGNRGKKRKAKVDAVAAALILEAYLASL